MSRKIQRHIPVTMATQHPDNAGAPYWERDGDGFVSVHEELAECVSSYRDLGVGEYMWDWEGKYADEAVIDKLFTKYYEFCRTQKIGKDIFLTFRVPNVWHEKGYSLIRALMVILTSEDFADDIQFKHRPLFEVILPMTENAGQLIYLQKSYRDLARFKYKTFNHRKKPNTEYLEIIPLVEGVEGQMNIRKLLLEYRRQHQKTFKKDPPYLRPFLARSDPALMSGLLATVLGNKISLSEIARFSRETKIPTFPMIGVGSLVFRGGLNPESIDDFVEQYGGVRTVTIQSAFRYDYSLSKVKKALRKLEDLLPRAKATNIPDKDRARLTALVRKSEKSYQETLHKLVKDVEPIFAAVPRRRERKLHIGFLGYGRSMGKTKLPRAINFTGAFYTVGIPPEFIGLGRFLAGLAPSDLALIKKYYPTLERELIRAGRFLRKESVLELAKKNKHWKLVEKDVVETERILGLRFGPHAAEEKLHVNLSEQVLLVKKNQPALSRLVTETGKLRKSLG